MAAEAAAKAQEESEHLPRRFWSYLTATAVSSLGDGMLVIGLPLMAASITRSPVWVAVVAFTQRLAPLLFSIPAGALVDRLDARRVAVTMNAVQAVLMGLAGALIAAGHFPLAALFALAFVTESLGAVFTCASGALIADVAQPSQYALANTRLRGVTLSAAFVVGPGLGGLVFSTGHQLPMLIDAASFVVAAVMLAFLRLDRPEKPKKDKAERHFLTEIKDGIRMSFRQPALRLMALILAVLAGFQAGSVAVIVLLGTVTLGLTQTTLGVTLACANIVAPASILFLKRIRLMRTSSATLLSIGMGCVGEVLIGTSSSPWQLGLGLAMDATAVTIGGVALMTARMRIVPREMLGRMTGGFSTVIVAAGTVGTLLGGALAKIDLRTPYLTCAGAFLVLFVVVYPRLAVLNGSPAEAAVVTIPAPAAPAEVDAAAGSGSASSSDPGWDPGSDPGSDPDLESGPESDPAVTRRKTREPVDRP